MHLNCKDWKRIRRKQQLQKCPNGQVMAIFEKSPKSRIFWKSTKGEPREIFQRLEKIEAKTAAPKVPEWPSYGNFRKVTQKPHFLKKCKGGTKGNFSKIAQKVALVWKAQKHSGANNIILYLVWASSARTGQDFGAKSGSKSARMAMLWQFRQGHPKNPHFLKKCIGGTKENFSKMARKVALVWKAQKHSGANNIIL